MRKGEMTKPNECPICGNKKLDVREV